MNFFSQKTTRAKSRYHGGIKPPPYKSDSLRSRIMQTPIPQQLVLPLLQHQGLAALPVVASGDKVLKNQVLAIAQGDQSLSLHAPTSGVIVDITDAGFLHSVGAITSCIKLQSDGEDKSIEQTSNDDYRSLSHDELFKIINEAGICGLGGAGFPTAKKIKAGTRRTNTLIINAAECEPYITADEALIREHAKEILLGAEILQSLYFAANCILAIEDNKIDAITALREANLGESIDIQLLKPSYPTGGEKQLIQSISGEEVPAGGIPRDIGLVVHNVGTSYAAYQAVCKGQPCISRITTVTGSPLQTPKNFQVLFGTPVSFLFQLCGIDSELHSGTIVGGSLMGIDLPDVEEPVIKTSNCLIAKEKKAFPKLPDAQACIRCGLCAEVCPASLLPQQLFAYSRNRDKDQLQKLGLFDCIECGACDWICPSHIPLVQYYRASKTEIRLQEEKFACSAIWQKRFQQHQYRIKKEKDKALDRPATSSVKLADNPIASEFSRDKAREDIAAAVARVQARKSKVITSSRAPLQPEESENE